VELQDRESEDRKIPPESQIDIYMDINSCTCIKKQYKCGKTLQNTILIKFFN